MDNQATQYQQALETIILKFMDIDESDISRSNSQVLRIATNALGVDNQVVAMFHENRRELAGI